VSGEWWRGGVIYQVYLRSFADADGDGVGDLRGLLGKVDYLAALGVDAVWVSPFYVSPQEDNGYDIADYDRIDPLFGSDEDLGAVVDALHARDIRLVIDLAVNHTSREHPWFQDARRPSSPRRDWYWWQARPTNWASYFSGLAWEWDDVAGAYYLHVFGASQPDLNWENPAVRAEVAALMRRWLDRGVDGFRLDVINFVSKVTDASGELTDAAAAPGATLADGRSEFVNGPRLEEYLHELDREVLSRTTRRGEPVVSIGEMPDVTRDLARRITDAETGSMDIVFSFDHVDLDHEPGDKWASVPVNAADVVRCLAGWQDALADAGWNSLYWSNHDQPRVISRWGDDGEHRIASAKTLGTVLHLMRGTPFVYQGEELGLPGAGLRDLDAIRDIESRNHYTAAVAAGADPDEVLDRISRIGRDNARTPMPWDSGPQGGFTDGEPWLAPAASHRGLDASAQRDEPGSVWHHYRRLIDLRHKLPVVVEGSFILLETGHPDLVAYRRDHDGEVLVVVAHLAEGSVPLPPALAALVAPGEVLLATVISDDVGTLGSWESRVHLVR
jgi:oligo-1,6-glucosidase